MADHGQDGGQINAEVGRNGCVFGQEAKQPPADADRRHALEHISRSGQSCGFFAKCAQHIGHAGGTAAVVANVIVVEVLTDQDAGVDAAQQVCLRRGSEDDQDRHHQQPAPLHIFCTDRAGAALADDQPDGRVLQTKVLADLVDEVALIAEVEQLLGVDEGHERRGRVEPGSDRRSSGGGPCRWAAASGRWRGPASRSARRWAHGHHSGRPHRG